MIIYSNSSFRVLDYTYLYVHALYIVILNLTVGALKTLYPIFHPVLITLPTFPVSLLGSGYSNIASWY